MTVLQEVANTSLPGVSDLHSQPGDNAVANFGNSVTTVGDSVETIGGVCDMNCIIF